MSYEYMVRMVCDRCGVSIESWRELKTMEAIKVIRWGWESTHMKTGVMIGLPNKRGKSSIYCQSCADGGRKLNQKEKVIDMTMKDKRRISIERFNLLWTRWASSDDGRMVLETGGEDPNLERRIKAAFMAGFEAHNQIRKYGHVEPRNQHADH